MKHAICPLSVVAVRNSASEKSEQVTQLLFGEVVEIEMMKGKAWTKVRCLWDNYIGWVRSNQLKAITPSELENYQTNYAFCLDFMQPIAGDGFHLPITIGARLPNFDGIRCELGEQRFSFSGQAVFPNNIQPNSEMLIKMARRYLYAPYQWGGRSPMGIDATGFTQVVFSFLGISLHREANQQVYQGEAVDFVELMQPGDLAFFENKRGNISHVGIVMPDGLIIHAAGRVRIDKLDHYGIFSEEKNKYTHKLRVIRRLLPKENIIRKRIVKEEDTSKNQMPLFEGN